ncbi:RNA-guided endonuclease InsQ/TnpB family protein [Tundrisphaera sp. TA3]|uniref:RNA-guided endonuclease InsQ/TnpB family protein n=1 Tax=Tundrisphaera sp. TA3 TaxID=3435775 RepID=UPI003EBAFD11
MADAEDSTIVLTYKFRLLPNRRQHWTLEEIIESQRVLYNAALMERIDCYRKTGRTPNKNEQFKELTELRKFECFAGIPLNLQRWTLKQLDDSYQAFFRRVKNRGGKAGHPRFRGKGRWQSFGFSEFSGITLREGRIRFKGLPGSLRIHLHRPLPKGKPLSCTFTRGHKGWYVCLQYRVPVQPLPATGQQVGIDVGLTTLATLSTGEAIANPRHTKRAEKELRRRQRALSRCKKGSNRRKKVKASVTWLHAKIANSRKTHLHQTSAKLVRENDLIAVEKLNVKGLSSGMLAKGVNDAGWSILKNYLAYKAAWAGRELVEVKAAGTSQTCPNCGAVAKKTLSERTHRCDCGCVIDRDHAAARIILARAVVSPVASQREALACA